ncbi:MAG: hypothetical protein FH748_08710 [Balneolaceae bacterium]|nr:hypothetical protein [Balneolaceae bacterium]
MSEDQKIKIPTWFWVVGSIALIWNLLGVMAYLMEVYMSPEAYSQLTTTEQNLLNNRPAWATAAYAIAVFSGAAGCVLLLLKKRWARHAFILSLVAVIVQMYHSFFVSNSFDVYGPGAAVMPLLIVLIGVGLIWLSGYANKKSWTA